MANSAQRDGAAGLSRRELVGRATGAALAVGAALLPFADPPGAASTEPLDLGPYTLTFSDDFDGFDRRGDARPDGVWDTRFVKFNTRRLPDNGESQIYMDPEYSGSGTEPMGIDPFHVQDGVLTIEARPTDPEREKPRLWDFPYVSGMISTERSFAQRYGYFEIRARMPRGRGLWPAFWMLPPSGKWPPEIDVFEVLGHEPETVYMTAHYPGLRQGSVTVRPDATHWHTYGVDWTPERIAWYIDRVPVFVQPNQVHEPMYLIANLAVGGKWPGYPDASTPFPARLEIDYIRAYARKDQAEVRR